MDIGGSGDDGLASTPPSGAKSSEEALASKHRAEALVETERRFEARTVQALALPQGARFGLGSPHCATKRLVLRMSGGGVRVDP